MEPAEEDGTEVDGPDVVGDLFESNVIPSEQVRDVDPIVVPSNASVG